MATTWKNSTRTADLACDCFAAAVGFAVAVRRRAFAVRYCCCLVFFLNFADTVVALPSYDCFQSGVVTSPTNYYYYYSFYFDYCLLIAVYFEMFDEDCVYLCCRVMLYFLVVVVVVD